MQLKRVRLEGMPVRLWAKATEHHDALMRELALLALDENGPELPRRLVALIHDLREAYGGTEGRDERRRAEALRQGSDTIDLEYEVPYAAKHAALALVTMLDEADEFCQGDSLLLTLAATPDEVAFRHWYVGEFVRQLDGGEPHRWGGPLE